MFSKRVNSLAIGTLLLIALLGAFDTVVLAQTGTAIIPSPRGMPPPPGQPGGAHCKP